MLRTLPKWIDSWRIPIRNLATSAVDTGHIYVSDGDVHAATGKHFDRKRSFKMCVMKLKACRLAGKSFLNSFLDGVFTVPGDGNIDF